MNAIIKTAVIGAVSLAGAYVLSTQGRTGHPGLDALKGWYYAHRGLHNAERPENSMAAFRAALEQGYGIELDIHLIRDGNLAVMHDTSLKRTAGADVNITELTTEELKNYRLNGTDETIPTFRQVLELFAGKAPLIIELKADGGNQEALVDAAVRAMEGYEGPYCMESFDPRCIHILKKKYPHIIRGQLTENFAAHNKTLHPAGRFVMTHNLLNFLAVPDFIAYRYCDRKYTFANGICRKLWKAAGVSWTLKTREEYDTAVKEGWIPIFEGFEP